MASLLPTEYQLRGLAQSLLVRRGILAPGIEPVALTLNQPS